MASGEREKVCAGLSSEIVRRLDIYVDLLTRWQRTVNLVAPSTIPCVWMRHVADSLQVQAAVPSAHRWVDFGSGGGFPGMVTAIVLADQPLSHVDLVESDKRKAAFLQTVSRETGVRTSVHACRIEALEPPSAVDAVSARALASLPVLIAYAEPFLLAGATGVFPKGQHVEAELTELRRDPRFAFDRVPSRTDADASLVIVRALGGSRETHGD